MGGDNRDLTRDAPPPGYETAPATALVLRPDDIESLRASRIAAMKSRDSEIRKALSEGEQELRLLSEASERFAKAGELPGKQTHGKVAAELVDISDGLIDELTNARNSYAAWQIRAMDKSSPISSMIGMHRASQVERFCAWSDDKRKMGYQIVHKYHGKDGFDATKMDKAVREAIYYADTLVNNPCRDPRFPNTLSELMGAFIEGYRLFDCVPLEINYASISGRGVGGETRKIPIGIITLDGGTIEPIQSTLLDLVKDDKESDNRSVRVPLYLDQGLVDRAKDRLRDAFPKADIDKANYCQRDYKGNMLRLFEARGDGEDDIIVGIRHRSTSQRMIGRGWSPFAAGVWVLQNWMRSLFLHISRTEPSLKHMTQILQLIGPGATHTRLMSIRRQLKLLASGFENWGTVPIINVAEEPDTKLEKIDFDPGSKTLAMISDALRLWQTIWCQLHGVDPGEIGFPSEKGVQEAGALFGGKGGAEMQFAQKVGFYGWMSYFQYLLTKVVALVHPDIVFRWTGLGIDEPLDLMVERQKKQTWKSTNERRLAENLDAAVFKFRIGKRPAFDVNDLPEERIQDIIQLLRMEQEEVARKEAAEQMAAQGAMEGGEMGPGGMEGPGGEGYEAQGSDNGGGLVAPPGAFDLGGDEEDDEGAPGGKGGDDVPKRNNAKQKAKPGKKAKLSGNAKGKQPITKAFGSGAGNVSAFGAPEIRVTITRRTGR